MRFHSNVHAYFLGILWQHKELYKPRRHYWVSHSLESPAPVSRDQKSSMGRAPPTPTRVDEALAANSHPWAVKARRALEVHRRRASAGSTERPLSLAELASTAEYVASDSSAWELKIHSRADGIRVWRRRVDGSPHVEVRGHGLLRAPPATVVRCLQSTDVATLRSFNPMYDCGHDVQIFDPSFKVAYARVRAAFPGFLPRDTVSTIQRARLPTGASIFLQRAVEHPDAPRHKGFVRAKIIRGVFIVQPTASKGETNFTFSQQVDAGGFVPAWVLNRLVAGEAVQFVSRLGHTARLEAAVRR